MSVEQTKYSILSCLEYSNNKKGNSERILREKLLNYRLICKQEMYNYSEQEFEQYMLKGELEYNLIYRALEEIYQCQIVCFEITEKKY